jgi:hypothetical protein
MKFHLHLGLALIALTSCGPRHSPQQPLKNSTAPVLPAPSAPPTFKNPAPTAEASATDNRVNLPEPKRRIDPASIEAAGQVVQHYGALIEKKRFAEAAKLWGDPGAAADFARKLDRPQVHLEVGSLGETEGAAGSIYTSVPVVFYGEGFRRPANIILRRVNDMPGSSEAQRRWHIERIEWDSSS